MSESAKPLSKPTERDPWEPVTAADLDHIGRHTRESFMYFWEVMSSAAERMIKAFEDWGRQLEQAGIVAGTAPTDPRERALWAKRNRGTGPSTPAAWHKR